MQIIAAIALALPGALPAGAQQKFEVASIRPDNSGPPRTFPNPYTYSPSGLFTATDVTLVDIIVSGIYPTRRIQMRGGPDWIDSERFDITAKADTTGIALRREDWVRMIQSLLEDRFKLVLHREMKEMPVYALIAGKTPPKIQQSKEEEKTNIARGDRGQLTFTRMPLVALVNTLANILHEPVVDGTGIPGFFDFSLDPSQFATPGAPEAYADLMLTAVEQQLGLKLEKRKAPLELTIIDHAERPGEN